MMTAIDLDKLHTFIVTAKTRTYAGSGTASLSYRPRSHDLQFHEGDFSYLDSYFGGTDFIGQEVVYVQGQAVWAMNYYGRILEPDLINSSEAGKIIKESLTELYKLERFLGGFEHSTSLGTYTDTNEGTVASFAGREWITRATTKVYELFYHGGLIKD
jgi:Domain of unknown function (DUF5680)